MRFAISLTLGVAVLLMATVSPRPLMAQASQTPLALKVGDTAPDFVLRDQNGKEVSLKDFQGKKTVVLAFFVFAFTGG